MNEKIGASLATSLVEEGYGVTLSTDLFGSQNGLYPPNAPCYWENDEEPMDFGLPRFQTNNPNG